MKASPSIDQTSFDSNVWIEAFSERFNDHRRKAEIQTETSGTRANLRALGLAWVLPRERR